MNEPRLRREAIVAQLAGELDEIVHRIEQLAPLLDQANHQLEGSAVAVRAALEQYRSGVALLSTEAMKNIGEYAVRSTRQAAANSIEQQDALIQVCARKAFEVELAPNLRELNEAVSRAGQDLRRSTWSRWLEHAATAFVAGGCAAAGVLYLVRV